MSLVPVTSHPSFTAASAAFQSALPQLDPAGSDRTSIPTELGIRRAVDALQTGIAELRPMTEPTTLWLHQSANAAIASATEAITLLQLPLAELAAGRVTPEAGSAATADAVGQARELIARADAQAML